MCRLTFMAEDAAGRFCRSALQPFYLLSNCRRPTLLKQVSSIP